MVKYLPFILILASCSQISQHPTPSDRELAAEVQMSCVDAAQRIVSSGLSQRGQEIARVLQFDEASFDKFFTGMSGNMINDRFNDSISRNELTAKMATRLGKIRNSVLTFNDPAKAMKNLSARDKKIVWYSTIKPQTELVGEEALKEMSEKGDEISTLLLQLPRGEVRNNAETAVVLMKRIYPETSTREIANELRKKMSVCLR